MSSDLETFLYMVNIGDRLSVIVGLFIIILSTIGNFCNCFVFSMIPTLNKHPNSLFLIGSSIGSLFFINIGLISPIIRVLTGIDPNIRWLFWCKLSIWLSYSGGCLSFICSCFAALSQFLITSSNIQWQGLITWIRAQFMMLLTAIICLLIFIPLPIYYNHIPTSSTTISCATAHPVISLYSGYSIIVIFYFLPIIVISILFCLTWYNLKHNLRRHRQIDGAVTRMMLIQMSVLLISGIPTGGFLSYLLATQYYTKPLLRLAYEYIIILILLLFSFLTNGISFWVFIFASKTFRKNIKEFVSKWRLFKNRTRPL
ncbi:hypothetical protein I4U23_011567 [Adineta vaga]|nr:hypothetical protein I4U23_011567 [Adineta vaga]